MLFCGAPVRPPSAARLFRAPGSPPPPRVRSASRGGGAQIPVSGGGGGGGRQCALRRSPKRTGWLSLSPSPSEPSSLRTHRESVLHSAELFSTPPPFSSLGRVGSDCPRGGGGGSGCRPRLAAPGSVPADPGEEVPPPPPLPPSRCPRAGLGRAAMPSDFISLLSADLDLESPKSLYSRGESGGGWGVGAGSASARSPGGSPSGPGSGGVAPHESPGLAAEDHG